MRASRVCSVAAFLPRVLAGPVGTDPASLVGSPEWLDGQAFQSAVLHTTNLYRSEHDAGSVSWNETLSYFAYLFLSINSCAFRHSNGPYGENIATGYATPAVSVELWGDERLQYDYGHPGFSHATGHFTQLVWKSTTDVGCAREWCGGYMRWFVACEYWPRGNVYGQFEQNVGRRTRGGLSGKPYTAIYDDRPSRPTPDVQGM